MTRPRRAFIGVIAAALVTTVSGCGLLSGEDSSTPAGTGVEKAKIRLGIIPIVDVAPVHIAIQKGYFRDEGVEVELKAIQGGAAGIPGLVNGELDVTFGNWVSFLAAQAKGATDLKLVADGYRGKPEMFLVMAMPGSPIKTAQDLVGKKVAVNTRGNVAELAVRAAVKAKGVDANTVQFTEMAFPDMQPALQRNDIDAALLVEPFITRAQQQINAFTVVDTMTGDASELPIGGYATSAKFAAGNPKTIDAFRRALVKAQRDAGERREVESVVTGYAKVDAAAASMLHLGSYPSSIDVGRLKGVVSLMKANGMLTGDVDPATMLLAP
ncbi:NitT/TauT family transport system substrate-binding protein [Kibdelosporangium banguiense]|uniref:NitT/TauT family transport system substrate-binding protein n=1 Tax=Kibdelosporangium banguiense TaxID=1365924 RepID=A0ABS4T842_9PSEU|nr:ABC transporter substrate-binding protein [Kibdelosporangium banguiense]MBP2320596.1 NitT/TauT family transport system substrate-binding protein [Kibdelosporangium banguiense]